MLMGAPLVGGTWVFAKLRHLLEAIGFPLGGVMMMMMKRVKLPTRKQKGLAREIERFRFTSRVYVVSKYDLRARCPTHALGDRRCGVHVQYSNHQAFIGLALIPPRTIGSPQD